MRRSRGFAILVCACAASAALRGAAALAGCPPPTPTMIEHPEVEDGDKVGGTIAMCEHFAFASTIRVKGLSLFEGRVDIFERPWPGAPWTFMERRRPAAPQESDGFGVAIAVEGDTLLIGAPLEDGGRGAVYVFRLDDGAWIETDRLTPMDAPTNGLFGSSLALDGNRALVGAYGDARLGLNTGAAYIFERADALSPFVQVQQLQAPDGSPADEFGTAVALAGDDAILGASSHHNARGAAYVFRRGEDGVWTCLVKLSASDAAPNDVFGDALAAEGDTLLVGAFRDDDVVTDSGSVYVFERIAGVWTERAKLRSPDPGPTDHFGVSVSLKDGVAIIGADEANLRATNAGVAHVFRRTPSGAFVWCGRLEAEPWSANDRFGRASALGWGTALVSAPFYDAVAPDGGAVFAYSLPALCPGDFDCSGDVGAADLAAILGSWGAPDPAADLSGDGVVGAADLAAVLGAWGPCVPK